MLSRGVGWHSLASIVLRLGAAGGKFVLVLVLARVLSPVDVGLYGLVASGVTLAVYVVGMHYYVVTTRQLLTLERSDWPGLIRDHVTLQGGLYLLVSIIFALVFAFDLLPVTIAPWLLPILLFEHASLEFSRLEIAQRRPLRAHILLFVRSGSWAVLWAASALVWPNVRDLDFVWGFWLGGGIVSSALGAFWNQQLLRESANARFESDRIRTGLRVAWKYLGAAISYYAMLTVDRYFLEAFASTAEVGVYTFYIGLAGGVIMIVQSGVVVSLFPDLVSAAGSQEWQRHRETISRMWRLVLMATSAATLVIAAAVVPALAIIDRQAYETGLVAYWLLLGGSSLAALSAVPHNVLYSVGKDSYIVGVTIAALIVAVVGDLVLIPSYGLEGAATATAAGFGVLLIGKSWYALREVRVWSKDSG